MKIVVKARRGGKTKALVDWQQEDRKNRVIIVLDEEKRKWLMSAFGLTKREVQTYAQLEAKIGSEYEHALDDLDIYTKMRFHRINIKLATITDNLDGQQITNPWFKQEE